MLKHKILTRLYNTPLLIEESKLHIITKNITLVLLAGQKPAPLMDDSEPDDMPKMPVHDTGDLEDVEDTSIISSNKLKIIKIHETLVAKNATGDSGTISYEYIARDIKEAILAGYKKLVFWIDSPGGEVSGCFGLANFIFSLPTKYGVETIAICDGSATSAAYVLASSCQKVLATNTTSLGSMAVIATLVSTVESDKMEGYEYVILRSKDSKALYNPHEGISKNVVDDVSGKIKIIDSIMNETINTNRSILTLDSIISLQGKTVLGDEALQLKLVDGLIDSFDMAIEELSTPTRTSINRGTNMNLEELQTNNFKLQEEIKTLKAAEKLNIEQAVANERARVLDILAAGTEFNIAEKVIKTRIEKGTSKEDALELFEAIKETTQLNNPSPMDQGLRTSLNEKVIVPEGTDPFALILKGNELLNA